MKTQDELNGYISDVNRVHFYVNAALHRSGMFNHSEYEDSLLWWMEESPLRPMLLTVEAMLTNVPAWARPEEMASLPLHALDDSLLYVVKYLPEEKLVAIGCEFLTPRQDINRVTYVYSLKDRAIIQLRVIGIGEQTNDTGRLIMFNLQGIMNSNDDSSHKFKFEFDISEEKE